jgi:serine/threonine protein kinase
MDGGTLDVALARTGPMALTVSQRRSIMLDVAHGLKYLHSRTPPVIHRDIHPSNVLLRSTVNIPPLLKPTPAASPSPSGIAVAGVVRTPAKAVVPPTPLPPLQWTAAVADFGSAVHSVDGDRSLSTAPGHITHSAPETMTGEQTTAVDVYGFGVLLYACMVSILLDMIANTEHHTHECDACDVMTNNR